MRVPGLAAAQLEALQDWAAGRRYIREVWVFGSRARGTHRPDSDLDLAFVVAALDEGERLRALMVVMKAARRELGGKLGLDVDPDDAHAPEVIAPAIKEHGICVFLNIEAPPLLKDKSDI